MDINSTKNVNIAFMQQRLFEKALENKNKPQDRPIVILSGFNNVEKQISIKLAIQFARDFWHLEGIFFQGKK